MRLGSKVVFADAHGPVLSNQDGVGLVLIDEVALLQDIAVQRGLVRALRGSLPRVQWLLTTSSPELAAGCEPTEILH